MQVQQTNNKTAALIEVWGVERNSKFMIPSYLEIYVCNEYYSLKFVSISRKHKYYYSKTTDITLL